MKTIGLYEAKTNLSALIAEMETTGEPVFLTRHGRIIAELRPSQGLAAPKRGCLKSPDFHLADDFDASETGFEDFFKEESPLVSRVAEEPPPYPRKKP